MGHEREKKSFALSLIFSILSLLAASALLILLIIWNGIAFSSITPFTITSYKYSQSNTFVNIIFIATVILAVSTFALLVSIIAVIKMDNYHHNCTFGLLALLSSIAMLANMAIVGYFLSLWVQQKDCSIEWKGMSITTMLVVGCVSGGTCWLLWVSIVFRCDSEDRELVYKQIDNTLKTQPKQDEHAVVKQRQERKRDYYLNTLINRKPDASHHHHYQHQSRNHHIPTPKHYLHPEQRGNYTRQSPMRQKQRLYPNEDIADPFIQPARARNPHYQQESVVLNLHPSLRKMDRKYLDYARDDEMQFERQEQRYHDNRKKNIPINHIRPHLVQHEPSNIISKEPYISPKRYIGRHAYN